MPKGNHRGMDEIDRIIMGVLANNPRTPYSEIANILKKKGYEMSSEGIRYRVTNLFEVTSTFFMIEPEEHDWHVLRLWMSINGGQKPKDDTLETIQEMDFWFLSQGFGSSDVYAVATAPSTVHIEEILDRVRGIDGVEEVNYLVETKRTIDVSKYLPITESD